MIVVTMLLSGAVAGLVGLPQLLGESHQYGLDFPAGFGLDGHLAIALLGRNHPVGIAIGALLWAWLERSAQILDLMGVSREIVTIMQGVIVLAVVVAWELVRRATLRRQQRIGGDAWSTPAPHRAVAGVTAVAGAPPAVAGARSAPRRPRRAGTCTCALWLRVTLAVVRAVAGQRRRGRPGPALRRARWAPRSGSRCRSCWPASARSGPSGPAWSTSASRG